jgi:kynurenine formamidase
MTNCIHDHAQWGAGDQLGAANHLSPATTLQALKLVEQGAIHDLSHDIMIDAPRIPPNQSPYFMSSASTWRSSMKRRAAMGAENGIGINLERIEMTVHVGTHIDALGHATIGDRMYGGRDANDIVGDFGLSELGVEQIPPIVTRGLCVDVSGLDGGAHLEAGRVVSVDDLKRAFDGAGVAPRAGDVVCINTGWGRYFMVDNARYTKGEPGIDAPAAEWLSGQGVLAIGCDNMAVEVLPGTKHPSVMMPVHQHCLAEAGVYLVENMVLDGLVAGGIREFCLVMLPVKFKGATGSPIRPIAMI